MADASNTPLSVGNTLLQTPASAIFPNQIGEAISNPSPFIIQARTFWKIVDTLWEGTIAMRTAAKLYLPQEPLEDDEAYARRLNRTTLHNHYKRTIQTGCAKIFTKDPYLTTDDPDTGEASAPIDPKIKSFVRDVDTQGRNLPQFAKEELEDAVNHGCSYILVDYASVPQDFANLAEEQESGNRPYWVMIHANNVLDARTEKFADGDRLSYFKFEEQVTEISSDLLSTNTFQQIRIFRQIPDKPAIKDDQGNILVQAQGASPVYFAVYRKDNYGSQWSLQRWGTISLNAIPVVPVYTNKIGFFIGKPPLLDLAEINIEHWQAKSDYTNILHVVNVPILYAKGFKSELDQNGNPKGIKIAPNSLVTSEYAEAELKYVEHTGKAIQAARQNIIDLEERMDALGLVLTKMQTAGVSATANQINTAEANSLLKSYALNLQDSLNAVLDFTCQYLDIDNTARVVINTDYAVDYTTDGTMVDVLNSFNAGVIDKLTVIAEGKRRNIFDPSAAIVPPPTNQSATPGGQVPPAEDPDSDGDNDSYTQTDTDKDYKDDIS